MGENLSHDSHIKKHACVYLVGVGVVHIHEWLCVYMCEFVHVCVCARVCMRG